jgi:uncharacterized repeat protein (TIGR03833 family)
MDVGHSIHHDVQRPRSLGVHPKMTPGLIESSISLAWGRRGMQPNQQRSQIKPGLKVNIVQKQHQRTGTLTQGIVKDILTNSPSHPHGIKVRLTDGKIGRVHSIIK